MRLLVCLIGVVTFVSLVGGRAISDPQPSSIDLHDRKNAPDEGDVGFYCGWGYTEKGLRGKSVRLTHSGVRESNQPVMNSAIVTNGCDCEWMNSPTCDPKNGYYLQTKEFMGDFGAPIMCYSCVVVAPNAENHKTSKRMTEGDISESAISLTTANRNKRSTVATEVLPLPDIAKREEFNLSKSDDAYAGWAYTEKGLRGKAYPISVSDLPAMPNPPAILLSAIISHGYFCGFSDNEWCEHGFAYYTAEFVGDFPQPMRCYHCVYTG